MFTLRHFLRHTRPQVLNNYLNFRSIAFSVDEKEEDNEKIADDFVEKLDKTDKRNVVEADFSKVYDMINERGTQTLIKHAKDHRLPLPEDFAEMNNYDKALWIYVNNETVFYKALTDNEIEHKKGWKTYKVEGLSKDDFRGREDAVSEMVKNYYFSTEMRGRNCFTELVETDKYICYVAYPEDYGQSQQEWEGNKPHNRNVRPSFRVFFLYITELEYLSVKVKGGNQKKEDLAVLFAKDLLGKELGARHEITYNLRRFVDGSPNFPFDEDRGLREVKVMGMDLYLHNSNAKVTIDCKNKDGHGTEEMLGILEEMQIPKNSTINSVKMRFLYKPRVKRSRGTVTVNMRKNGSCDLSVKELELDTRKYLIEWGIEKPRLEL